MTKRLFISIFAFHQVISGAPGQIRVPVQVPVSQSQMTLPVQGSQGQMRPQVQIGGLQVGLIYLYADKADVHA